MLKKWYKLQKPHKLKKTASAIAEYQANKKYDAIVVGAGPAGATAAYFMAREGINVLLLERGPYPGAKTCGGASLAAEHVHKLFPNFWEECQCERIVTDQSYWWMTEDSVITARFRSMKLAAAPYNRFTVKRTKLQEWLVKKAHDAGATVLMSHHVSEVLFEDGQAVGVRISPPQRVEFTADIVILADGANSLLAERAGLTTKVSPANIALYVKETIALPSKVIEERFNLLPGHGAVIGLIGYPTAGFNGTGSIHTFKDSINLSVGIPIADFAKSGIMPADLLERIKKHPYMQSLIEGGMTIEYGASPIPEGGYCAIPDLVHPGLMLVGDAGSLVNGVQGINLAMFSGYFAAKAACAAKISRDFSAKKLSLYKILLDESFVMQDLKANAGAAKLMKDIPYLFDLYTRMANEAAYHTVKVYTMPKRPKRRFIFKKVTSMQPILKILRDVWKCLKVMR